MFRHILRTNTKGGEGKLASRNEIDFATSQKRDVYWCFLLS